MFCLACERVDIYIYTYICFKIYISYRVFIYIYTLIWHRWLFESEVAGILRPFKEPLPGFEDYEVGVPRTAAEQACSVSIESLVLLQNVHARGQLQVCVIGQRIAETQACKGQS